jgi:GntR family transcriptional regulator/MocR family aminotransferase
MAVNQSTSAAPALIGPAGSGPAHQRLAEGIRAAIRDGRLRPGEALPSSRNLAGDLGLSRWVVTEAYQQLTAEGYLTARTGSATRVAPAATPSTARLAIEGAADPADPPPGVVDLRPGVPDLGSFPRAAWSRAYSRVVRTLEPEQWRYPDPHGAAVLRSTVADYLRRVRGVAADPDRVLITAGTADAMRHVGRLLADTGRTRLAVEDPGWPALAAAATSENLAVEPIPVDGEGLVVDALPAGVASVLVTPAHQFPTGVALSAARRIRLLRWAADNDAVVIEDDYDAEFRYDRRPIGALAGLDPDRVIYLGSVSKTLAPALRLGWLVAPPALRESLTQTFAGSSRSALEQHALATFIARGDYDRHLRRMRRQYEARRDALLAGLRRDLPSLQVSGVAAGLHLLIRLPDRAAEARTVECLVERGIWITPLSRYRRRSADAGIVVSFARLAPHHATAVSRQMASALRDLHQIADASDQRLGVGVLPAGLDQQHGGCRIGRQAVGQHATRRPGADNDEVEVPHG